VLTVPPGQAYSPTQRSRAQSRKPNAVLGVLGLGDIAEKEQVWLRQIDHGKRRLCHIGNTRLKSVGSPEQLESEAIEAAAVRNYGQPRYNSARLNRRSYGVNNRAVQEVEVQKTVGYARSSHTFLA